jgi:hypothetical protein
MAEEKNWHKNKRAYNLEYDRKNKVHICVKLNRSTDAELIEIYQSIPNKAQWIKDCLAEYGRHHPIEPAEEDWPE